MSMRRFLPRLALALLLVAAVGWTAVHRDQINLTTLDAWLGSFGLWAPIAYVTIYGLLALALLAAIALLPRLIGRLRRSFAWIEANALKRRLDNGEAVTVIDVRGPDEFMGPLGHIASARNIPVAELEQRISELTGLERAPVVLVCRTDKRSATAARTLRAAGFTQVSVLRRGMEQWNETSLPVEVRTVEGNRMKGS
jgi:rhodanese-related sulfurtransferase